MDKNKNFLEFIPRINPALTWRLNDRSLVEIQVIHSGFFAKIAQQYFHKPPCTNVELEEMGSFIWRHIDGKRNVYELGKLVNEAYAEKAEPLYERLSVYLKQLERLQFLNFKT